MRRNLRPEQLGDLLELPLNAVIALHRRDGSVMQTPVWHEWTGTAFRFYIPAGDRKIAMLQRDPRISLVVADSAHPFRTMQVEGIAAVSTEHFRDIARRIARGMSWPMTQARPSTNTSGPMTAPLSMSMRPPCEPGITPTRHTPDPGTA